MHNQSWAEMRSLETTANFQIQCFNKTNSNNSIFDSDIVNNAMLHDIIKLIGAYPTLDGLVDQFNYKGSTRRLMSNGTDIMIPKFISIDIEVIYTGDSLNPHLIGSP